MSKNETKKSNSELLSQAALALSLGSSLLEFVEDAHFSSIVWNDEVQRVLMSKKECYPAYNLCRAQEWIINSIYIIQEKIAEAARLIDATDLRTVSEILNKEENVA